VILPQILHKAAFNASTQGKEIYLICSNSPYIGALNLSFSMSSIEKLMDDIERCKYENCKTALCNVKVTTMREFYEWFIMINDFITSTNLRNVKMNAQCL